MAGGHLGGKHLEPDALEPAGGAGEVAVDELAGQPDGLEDLRAGVGGDRADAHLGHHLQHALAERLDEVVRGLVGGDADEVTAVDQVGRRLERQVRVHRGSAVAEQQRGVVHLAHVAALDDEADPGALAAADQVVVDGAGQQQARDGREAAVGAPVGQHDDPRAALDLRVDLGEDLLEPRLEADRAARRRRTARGSSSRRSRACRRRR